MSTTQPSAPAPPLSPPGEDVRIELPADVRHLTTVRVLAASLAAAADMTMDDLDDIQVGVDELMTLLVESIDGEGTITFTFRTTEDGLHVLGEAPAATSRPQLDDLSARILDAVVDSHAAGRGWVSLYRARTGS